MSLDVITASARPNLGCVGQGGFFFTAPHFQSSGVVGWKIKVEDNRRDMASFDPFRMHLNDDFRTPADTAPSSRFEDAILRLTSRPTPPECLKILANLMISDSALTI